MKFVEHYREVKERRGLRARDWARYLMLSGISSFEKYTGSEAIFKTPRVQFLYLHHVFKDEEARLDTLLQKLSKHHTFIGYGEAVDRILQGKVDKPYITFSTDDGFRNNLQAAEILNRYGAKACFFVNPSIVGETDFETIASYCTNRLEFYPTEFLNWDDIAHIQAMGHEIGSHSMDHFNLAGLSEYAIVDDLKTSFDIIKQRCGVSAHFAFPFGRFHHFSNEAREICFKVGYTSCATAERGCHINHPVPLKQQELCILRDHIILGWNMDHIIYFFLANNVRQAKSANNLFPY
jgi:peptidoglycan/xylan/chitin deacetylase (PgdA/CDA1 family)